MNKNILLVCALAIAAVSCSDDYDDATSKHVYSENDNVSLNTSVGVWQSQTIEFAANNLSTCSINLYDYAADFKSQFGMTVDDVIKAVGDGSIKFRPIYTSSGQWVAEPYNNGIGWAFNLAGKVCDSKAGKVSVSLNQKNKTLDVVPAAGLSAGTAGEVNVGFAQRSNAYGTYDKYVRIQLPFTVTDKSVIMGTLPMAEGDYAGYEFFFQDNYDDQFMACMGMDAQTALNGLADGTVGFAVTDANGKAIESDYTADAGDGYYGYWFNSDAQICNWGDAGCAVYCDAELGERAIYFGRYPGYSGADMTIYTKLYLLADPEKCIRFIFTLQF